MTDSSVRHAEQLTIPADHSVHYCDLDADKPYCVIRPDSGDMEPATKLVIPHALAYFLRTHWCGSAKMHDLIESNKQREIKNAIFEALGASQ